VSSLFKKVFKKQQKINRAFKKMPVTLALYKVTVIFGPMYCTWQIQISRVTAPTLQSSMN